MAEMKYAEEEKKAELLRHQQVYGKARLEAPAEVSTNTKGAIAVVANNVLQKGEGYSNSILGESQRLGISRKAGDPGEMSTALRYEFASALEGLEQRKTSLLSTPKKV